MADSQIRWRKSDYITLGKAVSRFNKIKNQLEAEGKEYLPETKNYETIKKNITTRSELNRIITSLKRFNVEGAETVTLESGQKITAYEYGELKRQRALIKRRLNKNLKKLNEAEEGEYSRVQMGSIEARTIEAQLNNLNKLEQKVGYEFNKLKNRIINTGTNDYIMQKSIIFRQNFMEKLNELKNTVPEFEKVYKYFDKIKNPVTFFETTQKSNVLQDFFAWYQNPEIYGNFTNEELATYIINEYNIDL